jgi:uncharacterized membrane protein YcaP (DUF421 family)
MNAFWNSFETLLGLGVEPRNLTFVQISLRGIIVFLVTLAAVRLGHKRSLSRKTPFDAVLLVILAAVLSRAINGSAAFFATLGGGVVLVALHRLFAFLAFYSHRFGILVKGRPDVIVRDGQFDVAMMWHNHVSTHDLDEDIRLSVHIDDLSNIRIARVERSGDISFIKNKLTRMAYDLMEFERLMRTKKRWIKPMLKTVPIFFECTCYAGAV